MLVARAAQSLLYHGNYRGEDDVYVYCQTVASVTRPRPRHRPFAQGEGQLTDFGIRNKMRQRAASSKNGTFAGGALHYF